MKLTAIYLYPVKSLPGLSVQRARVGSRGLEHDRRWMVVAEDGGFVTQRTDAGLANVTVEAEDAGWRLGGEVRLPRKLDEGPRRQVRVWDSDVQAIAWHEADELLSNAAGKSVSLVYMPDDAERVVRRAPEVSVGFADAYPFLIIGEASLQALNERLGAPVDMRRFRPNLVFSGGAAHVEDSFESIHVGAIPMRGIKRCERCSMVGVDPETARRGAEPMRTLATYRRDEGKVWFGMNLVHEAGGEVRLGDPITPG